MEHEPSGGGRFERSARRFVLGRRTSALEDLVGPDEYPQALGRGGAALTAIGAAGVLVAVLVPHAADATLRRGPLLGLLTLALATSGLLWTRASRWPPAIISSAAMGVGASIVIGVALLGPGQQQSAAALASMAGPMFFFLPRRAAALVTGLALAGYAVMLGTDSGYPGPVTRWLIVASLCASSAVVMDWIAGRLRSLSSAERTASAEVVRLNGVLAQRVDDLGRFLAPQVADAVRDAGDRDLLLPHRRQVAVIFIDLRGFTGFTAGSEPEEVVEVLSDYYAAVGETAHRMGATIGSFIGDGIMAYFGDPVPMDDPARQALAMAVELRPTLDALAFRWDRLGYHLGYGMGIAYGYATLGSVGFEGRRDYTALGTVVNLAARLCGEAVDGEILLDSRAHDAIAPPVEAVVRTCDLRGFGSPVTAHSIPRRLGGSTPDAGDA